MTTETDIYEMIIDAVGQCPPALQGDTRASFILGFLISSKCPTHRKELFKLTMGMPFDEAIEQLKGAFDADD